MVTDMLQAVIPTGYEHDYSGFIQGIYQATVVALDTETTGLDVKAGKDYCQGISLAYRVGGQVFSEYFPFRHASGNIDVAILPRIYAALELKAIIFHNAKFDLHSLTTLGVPFKFGTIYDTGLLAHMINENSPYEKSLENCARKYIGKGKVGKDAIDRFTKTFGWGAVPPHLMAPYAKGDAEVTLELWEHLWPMFLKKFGDEAEPLWNWDMRMIKALFGMEQRGIEVDQKFCREYASIAEIEMADIEDSIGFKPSKTTDLAHFLFDVLKLPILAYTKGSYNPDGSLKAKTRPAMTKTEMEEYERMLEVENDDRARQVLDFRGWQKATSSFYIPFQTLADQQGKIHCNYKQHGTVTGRLSCSEPNLQQIPRQSDKAWNGRIRTAFRPTPGFTLIGFDYSQLELRLAAAYGQEQWLIDEFAKADADPFTVLALLIGTDRYTAKTFTYAMIYGAGLEKIAKTLKRTVPEIQEAYDNFQQSIKGIIRAKRLAETKIKQRGYIRYWTGRRRHLYPDVAYKGFNALLQGGGAEVVKRVLVICSEEICDDNCRLLLQVHDELVFEIREGMEEEYSARIIKVMEELPTKFFGVQFAVHGKEWGLAA